MVVYPSSPWTDHGACHIDDVNSSRLAAGGSSWGPDLRVSDNTVSRKLTPQVAVGADGTAYAVWEDDRSGNWDIWFSTLPAGSSTWTANVKISDDPGTAAQYDAQIGISAAGDLLVIWQDDRVPNTEVRMRRRLAGQSNWQASIVASDAASIPVSLALGVRSDGNALAAWQDARGASYDIWGADYTFATNTWSVPAMVSDDPATTAQMRPAAALSTNEVAVAWRDDRVTGGDIRARRRTSMQGVDHFTYAYDGLNRLMSSSGTTAESFVLDAATNIASRTGPSAAYTYDEANRRTSDGAQTLQWNAADRLVQQGAKTFVHDSLGHLTSFVDGSGSRAYAYDGDGLLSSRTQNAVQNTYLWDASVTPARLMLAGADRLVYGLGPLYLVQGSGTVTIARDALASVRAEVNDAAVVSRSLRYTAYGSLTPSSTGAPTLLGYSGELGDNSGLLYLRARWYDPIMGLFTARDDVSGVPSAPVSLNGYSYAAGNPTGLTDPSGHCVPPPGGVGYCIERFIPTARSCNLFGILCGGGDARVGPDPSGGGYRVRQLVDGAGKITAQASPSTAFILGIPVGSSPGYLGTGSCAGFTDPTAVRASCVAYNGYGDATTLLWPIGSLAPPGPIQTTVQINVVDGRVVVSAQGTLYPSLEIWRYGPAGPQLVYFYNAIGVGQEGLGAPGNLPNSAGK